MYVASDQESKRKPIQPHEPVEIPATLEAMVLSAQSVPADNDSDLVEAQRKDASVHSSRVC